MIETDIKEIKIKKEEMRAKVVQLIEEFEKETGAYVKAATIIHEGQGFASSEKGRKEPIVIHMTVEV